MKILLNTSFHMHQAIEGSFVQWIKDVYQPAALADEALEEPTFARMMIETEPGVVGYCFQMQCRSLEDAQAWHDGPAAGLRMQLTEQFGRDLVFFTTYMEIIPING